VVAHDLKSPLTNLIGYGDILTEQHTEELGTTATGYIGKIVSNAGRMWTLIDDLLSYTAARDATLTREPVDLDGLLHNVIAERREGLSEQPQIEAGCLPTVQADPVLLRQVLDNLIGNAIKYVRPGATACIQVTAETVGEDWLITISDRGIGIDGADRADVFGAFHRARGSEGYPGTGLGLAISQRIIHRHGGQIGVSPNPAGGSRFWFTLPILNTAPPPSRPARSGSSPRELAGLEAS
jgi:signal transduction histidine kinase